MKKRLFLAALLLAAVLLLCACAANDQNNTAADSQAQGQVSPLDNPAQPAANVGSGLPAGYNPASEEDGLLMSSANYDANGNKVYAGATPIRIDPVDMPTATPRPELTFTYDWYTASKLNLTFKSAVGYTVNDSLSDMYILTEPAAAVRDNYPCVISLSTSPITKNYDVADVKKDLAAYLQNEGKLYDKWETWTAASSTLMGGKGYYNNYRGVLADGTIVRGRVHMAIISENQLLILHISAPGWYNSSYMKIYDQIRSSIKTAK